VGLPGADLPSATPNFKNEVPLGVCSRCARYNAKRELARYQFLITQDGRKICPECDVSSPPSGLRVTGSDPGLGFFKKIINAKGFEEYVPDDKSTTVEEAQVDIRTVPSQELKVVNLTLAITELCVNAENGTLANIVMKRLYDALDGVSYSTIGEAKRVIQLQVKIEKILAGPTIENSKEGHENE